MRARRLLMPVRRGLRRALVTAVAVTVLVVALVPSTAAAHSLTSSTIAVRVAEDSVDATVSLPLETLDEALGTGYATDAELAAGETDEVIAYIDEHLTVTDTDGTTWEATYDNVEREAIEGIESFSVDVHFATGDSSTSHFTVAYDGIIEAVPGHEAVVVLTDSAGKISTPGIIDTDHETLEVVDGGQATPVGDMVRYGFHHVLEGVDHLLFLLALLLPAPLIATAGRWRRGTGPVSTAKAVLRVITAFTLGHSITLIAAALGWITVPTRPVEVLIAASVGVAAVHAIRPLAARGEVILAMGFGLIHGLAFAGILADLGIDGTTSLLSLLAFNVGIELAQLTCVALVFPSLYVLSRTRFYPAFRVASASLALVAATGWGLDRLGVLANPLGPVEAAAVAHLSGIVALLAGLAILARLVNGRPGAVRVQTASE
jgi:HupE / UreJ protein